MAMKFLPDVGIHKGGTKSKFCFDITDKHPEKSRFLEMQFLGMLTSRNFEGISILT